MKPKWISINKNNYTLVSVMNVPTGMVMADAEVDSDMVFVPGVNYDEESGEFVVIGPVWAEVEEEL